jgi:hypothetical protein
VVTIIMEETADVAASFEWDKVIIPQNASDIFELVKTVAEEQPEHLKAFMWRAITTHAREGDDCPHRDDPPEVIPSNLPLADRKAAAMHHLGACGFHNAADIVEVDITGAAERLGVDVENLPATKIRNQACFEAAKKLGAYGKGVQIRRSNCFAKACRAVFYGEDPLPYSMLEALLS